MIEHKPIFLRAHTEIVKLPTGRGTRTAKPELDPKAKGPKRARPSKWPEHILAFDCETTTDSCQALTFATYQFCRAFGDTYECIEEGIFYADEVPEADPQGLEVLKHYVQEMRAETPGGYPQQLRLLSRSEFVEKGLWSAGACAGALMVGFNLPFDVSRLAIDNRDARHRNETWSLVMLQDKCPKTGSLREHPFRPRVIVTPKDSKAAFIRFAGVSKRSKKSKKRLVPYAPGRFLDLRTLGWALRNESYSLQRACEAFGVPGKLDHQPTGQISREEIDYCRQDVRSTVALLNAMRAEFDQHPIDLQPERAYSPASISKALKMACKELHTKHQKSDHEPSGTVTIEDLEYARQDVRCSVDVLNSLKEEFDRHRFNEERIELYPDKAVSPASIGKAYLRAMGITPLKKKFNVPDYIYGIASQAYFGGRAECRIRNTPVPAVLTDFSSQYPTINSLLGNPEVLIAETLSFEDATAEIRNFVEQITLDNCFEQEFWKKMKFFARIRNDNDIVPVRAEYNDDGLTKNIGVNYFTSSESVWLSGPDVIASKLLAGKVPHIEKAIRMVPHGQQKALKPTNLRGMVEVDPRKDDFDLFRVMVEQKEVYKHSNEALSYFLKICANSTSYGIFYELTPQKKFNPVKVKVFSGDHSHEQSVTTIEKPGEWYFPPIAGLITGGAHLLLAMLERCVTDKGGHYLFCDTDSMCIVASRTGGWVGCPNEPRIKALSWKDVEQIANRFISLNCYDRTKVPGSILKIEKVNCDGKKQIDLFGLAVSAKRYVLYRYDAKADIAIVDAKAHGLGYLYPPKDRPEDDSDDNDWILEAWHWVLEGEVARPRGAPGWFSIPAMMRMTVSTPAILGMLKGFTKPFNFIHVPLMFPHLYPAGKDPSNFSLIMPFSKHRDRWLHTKAIDTHTGEQYSITLLDPKGRTKKIEVKCYGNILGAYREHPETKFLGHDGKPCDSLTRGLLRRSHIVANRYRYIGKETSRRWEQGDDKSMVDFRCAEYGDGKMVADKETRKRILETGIRKVARQSGINRETVALVANGKPVKPNTIAKIMAVT